MQEKVKRNFGVIAEKVFLDNKPRGQAINELLAKIQEIRHEGHYLDTEIIPTAEGLNRILAEPAVAKRNSPHFAASAMDGIAVLAEETFGASDASPIVLTLGFNAQVLDTGDLVPEQFNAVIMNEYIQVLSTQQVQIHASAVPGQHVRQVGEDIAVGDVVVPAKTRLKSWDVGACMAAGIRQISVLKKPRAAFLPTGSELVPALDEAQPGELVEFNSYILKGLLEGWGAEVQVLPITPDEEALLEERMLAALGSNDIVIINAGSSAGREDFTAQLVEKNGELLTHGVAIKPGKPVILGIVGNKPVIGLPGYPVAAALTADLFIRPLLELFTGQFLGRPKIKAIMEKKAPSPLGVEEYLRVTLEERSGQWLARSIKRGAGVISSLVKADGLVVIPANSEGVAEGEEVDVELLRGL